MSLPSQKFFMFPWFRPALVWKKTFGTGGAGVCGLEVLPVTQLTVSSHWSNFPVPHFPVLHFPVINDSLWSNLILHFLVLHFQSSHVGLSVYWIATCMHEYTVLSEDSAPWQTDSADFSQHLTDVERIHDRTPRPLRPPHLITLR